MFRLLWNILYVVCALMCVKKLFGTMPVSFMNLKIYKMFLICESDIVLCVLKTGSQRKQVSLSQYDGIKIIDKYLIIFDIELPVF